MKKSDFTANEWEIIRHRLDADDAIAEVYSEDVMGIRIMDNPDCHAIISSGIADIENDVESKLTDWIITDAIDGSTFFCNIEDAVADGEITKGKFLAYRKAALSIETKTGVAIPL